MQRRSTILLIGVILTVGFSVVGGIGIVDVSAADTLVVDNDGTAEYSSIQAAIDDASAGDTVEIRPGTYPETVVIEKNITVIAPDGATLDGTNVNNPFSGVTIEPFQNENIAPTIRGITITRYETGIDARFSTGDWVVSDVTVQTVQQVGINARDSSGDWTLRDSEVVSTGLNGVSASSSNGEWTIEDTVIRRTELDGINARSTFDDWTIRNVSVGDISRDGTSAGISADRSAGNWVIEQSSVKDGIDASNSDGDWEIRQSNASASIFAAPLSASNTAGQWSISQSTINNTADNQPTINAEDAVAEGSATDNWWGSPSGPDEDACVGNVDCSSPLTTRPTDVGYNPDDSEDGTDSSPPTIAAIGDSGQIGGTAEIDHVLSNITDQSSVELTTTEIDSALTINESASDFFGGKIEQDGRRVIYSQPSGTANPEIVYDIPEPIAVPTVIGYELTFEVTVAVLNEDATVTDTDTATIIINDVPNTPGKAFKPVTTENPSPSKNRGAFAGVTPYTTTDDVILSRNNTVIPDGGIGNDAVIFQGEKDIMFEDVTDDEIPPSSLKRTAGANEGVTLELPVPKNQAVGRYLDKTTGLSVTVQQPQVTEVKIQNDAGEDVSGDILSTDQNDASVLVEYNYEEAENIELTIENENGVDVTQEALDVSERNNKNADTATPTGSPPDGQVRFELNPANLDGGEYTFTTEGVEDLDFRSATQSVTTRISTNQTSSNNVTRTISSNKAAPGSTVAVTTKITGASGSVSTSSSYEPRFSSATVEVAVNGDATDPIIDEANSNGSTVTLGDVGTDATVTITEELTVGEELNVTHSVTGDVTLGETTTEIEPVSVTVADTEPQSPVDEFDEDGNGNIEITELGQAGQAFASGELTITELGEVGAAFAS